MIAYLALGLMLASPPQAQTTAVTVSEKLECVAASALILEFLRGAREAGVDQPEAYAFAAEVARANLFEPEPGREETFERTLLTAVERLADRSPQAVWSVVTACSQDEAPPFVG